jgi:hypothetical protein
LRGNAKCDNRYLSSARIEAANFAIRFSPEIRRRLDRKASKKPRPVAIKSVTQKLGKRPPTPPTAVTSSRRP